MKFFLSLQLAVPVLIVTLTSQSVNPNLVISYISMMCTRPLRAGRIRIHNECGPMCTCLYLRMLRAGRANCFTSCRTELQRSKIYNRSPFMSHGGVSHKDNRSPVTVQYRCGRSLVGTCYLEYRPEILNPAVPAAGHQDRRRTPKTIVERRPANIF